MNERQRLKEVLLAGRDEADGNSSKARKTTKIEQDVLKPFFNGHI